MVSSNRELTDYSELKLFLDEKVACYNQPSFIETDPIQIPKLFTEKEDVEIAAFLAATLAWGQRPVIIRNASRLLALMDNNPYDFLLNVGDDEWRLFEDFRHRTLNGDDCVFLLKALKNIYQNRGGLEQVFAEGYRKTETVFGALSHFRNVFFETDHQHRSEKHVSSVEKGASAKRLNMFLRWMVRYDDCGVDFGLWKQIPSSVLMLPLDLHTGNVARKLGVLVRKQNDWKAVEEVTTELRRFDRADPVKYDFALFGLGAFESF